MYFNFNGCITSTRIKYQTFQEPQKKHSSFKIYAAILLTSAIVTAKVRTAGSVFQMPGFWHAHTREVHKTLKHCRRQKARAEGGTTGPPSRRSHQLSPTEGSFFSFHLLLSMSIRSICLIQFEYGSHMTSTVSRGNGDEAAKRFNITARWLRNRERDGQTDRQTYK